MRDGPVDERRVERESDIQRQALASKFAQVLPVVLERCARLLKRPGPIEEVELVDVRSDDKWERRAQDRKPHRPLNRRRQANRHYVGLAAPPLALSRIERKAERGERALDRGERRARGFRGNDNVDVVEIGKDADVWVQRAELITDRFESVRNEDRKERGAERAAFS